MYDDDRVRSMTARNFEVGRRYFSLDVLEEKLLTLLSGSRQEVVM
jgi:hypothetical protein